MMSQKLKQRLDLLLIERNEKSTELEVLDEMIAVIKRRLKTHGPNRQDKNAAQWAWELLRQHGPLSPSEIAGLMIQHGYQTTAKSLRAAVYQRMWEARSWFEQLPDRRWQARGTVPPYEREPPNPSKVRRNG